MAESMPHVESPARTPVATPPRLDVAPYRPSPAAPDRPRWRFTRAYRRSNPTGTPRAIAWFGFRSFWGHLRHFMASAIATEDVDTRDWMEPTRPLELEAKVARTLGAVPRGNLVESLGRDVFVDFVADTGDDGEVSQAVGHLVFRPYTLPDPRDPSSEIVALRGDVLLHGGDIAYPVATATQIHDRFVVPWNRALREVGDDDATRVLLGIPGNHDWYDGLDGFARLVRERHLTEKPEPPVDTIDTGFLPVALRFVGDFVMGESTRKPPKLVLAGYDTVQRASYFILPLTRRLHVHAVDRQLRQIDYRQKRFFQDHAESHPDVSRIVVLPDPVLPYGRPSRSGLGMLHALKLSPDREPHLLLAGDIHHYRRERLGKAVHVTAGGGGAFLHPAPLRGERVEPDAQWPGPKQCRALLHKVAIHIMAGRAGLIAHAVMAVFFVPAIGLVAEGDARIVPAAITAGLFSAVAMALIGGVRKGPWLPISALAALAGCALALVPTLTVFAFEEVFGLADLPKAWWTLTTIATTLLAGGFVYGSYLAGLTLLGLESSQAFTALSHPGFRHFVRLRIRADGSGVDGWCIGLEDPLAPDEKPVLVDAFSWELPELGTPSRRSLRPPRASPPPP